MRNLTKYSLFALFSFFVFACANPTEKEQNTGAIADKASPKMAETVVEEVIENILEDPKLTEQGLISGLYGNWINEADKKEMMVFSGTDLARIYDGKMKKIQQPVFFVKCPAGCDTNNSPENNNKCIKMTNKDGSSECYIFEELTSAKLTYKVVGSEELVVFKKQK